MKTTLDKLKPGMCGIILQINIDEIDEKKHLLDMGLVKGTNVKIKKIAPMGDPVSIYLRGYELCISKNELKKIIVSI